MNQLTETLKSMEGMELPDKTTFGHFNYLTPGPKHPVHSKTTVEKLARRLKKAADSLEDVPKLSMLLFIIATSLMRNEASRSYKALSADESMKKI